MITTQINEQGDYPNTYPLLMQSKETPGLIVLFEAPGCGTIVACSKNGDERCIGMPSQHFVMNEFELFYGTLELRNS